VLEAVFVLLEFPSPSRRIFIGSHSLLHLWFAVSVLHCRNESRARSLPSSRPRQLRSPRQIPSSIPSQCAGAGGLARWADAGHGLTANSAVQTSSPEVRQPTCDADGATSALKSQAVKRSVLRVRLAQLLHLLRELFFTKLCQRVLQNSCGKEASANRAL
jgi:hypothetical protein